LHLSEERGTFVVFIFLAGKYADYAEMFLSKRDEAPAFADGKG